MSWLDTLEDIRTKDFAKATEKQRDKAAKDVVNLASYACAVVAVSPIPFSDAVLMLPVQSAMVVTIGHIYGRKLTQAASKDLIVELGATAGVGMLARQGIKALLPVVGALLTVPAAFAANWGMGRVAIEYFKNPGAPREHLRRVYELAKQEGSGLFSRERFDAFRRSGGRSEAPGEQAEAPKKKTRAAPKKRKAGAKKKKPKADTRSQAQVIVEDDFSARLAAHPEVREAIAGSIHLDLTGDGGGQWTADLAADEGWIRGGFDGTPKLTVRCPAPAFIELMERKRDVQLAVLDGTLKLEPMDLSLAKALGPLFA